ncbi:hypothetical protein MX629_11570 [Carnobacterium divergens]|uniref:Uncharacterized protein n=1 Tax=Carnobacterium divergens TaxID=2748 RepID=A0AAW8RG66_CARDV|nr:hypothetical protein [Carnobacterium divergens]MDT1959069.1 hypothetical protein [Carnobacterium divergens]MDT1975178.1 hypothetical protein [Carnobacterium divergens]
MKLNPFIYWKKENNLYCFFEKFSKSPSFFKISAKKIETIEDILNNLVLVEMVSKKINYAFAIKDNQEVLYCKFLDCVINSEEFINKYILAKFILTKLKQSKFEIINYSNEFNSERLNETVVGFNGNEFLLEVFLGENQKYNNTPAGLNNKKGIKMNFSFQKDQLYQAGPFIELEKNGNYYFNLENYPKKIIKTIEKQTDFFNRDVSEVIIDFMVTGIMDYFSDYIAKESPLFNRSFIIDENNVHLTERFI